MLWAALTRRLAGYSKSTKAAIITEQRLQGGELCSMDSVSIKTQPAILYCKNRRTIIDFNTIEYIDSFYT